MPNGWSGRGKGGGKGGKGGNWGYGSRREEFGRVIESYLQPLLLQGLRRTLAERSDALLSRLSKEVDDRVPLRFDVLAKSNKVGVVASCLNAHNASPLNAGRKPDDAIVDLALTGGATLFTSIVGSCAVIYNRAGERIANLPPSLSANHDAKPVTKWLYANPIVEASGGRRLSDQVIGILQVEGSDDRAYNLFTNGIFQQEVDTISAAIGPYLTVFIVCST